MPNLIGYTNVIKNVGIKLILDNLYITRFWQMVLPFNSYIEQSGKNRFFIKILSDEPIEGEMTIIEHGFQNNGSYLVEIYMKPNEKIERFDARLRIREISRDLIKVGFYVQEFIPRSILLLRRRFRMMVNLRKSIREAINNLEKFAPLN